MRSCHRRASGTARTAGHHYARPPTEHLGRAMLAVTRPGVECPRVLDSREINRLGA